MKAIILFTDMANSIRKMFATYRKSTCTRSHLCFFLKRGYTNSLGFIWPNSSVRHMKENKLSLSFSYSVILSFSILIFILSSFIESIHFFLIVFMDWNQERRWKSLEDIQVTLMKCCSLQTKITLSRRVAMAPFAYTSFLRSPFFFFVYILFTVFFVLYSIEDLGHKNDRMFAHFSTG
jgi:hypothetical protein